MAKVLIVTRTKNREILLKRAIESINSQTYTDWHHVIVNDGGNPGRIKEAIIELSETYRSKLSVIHNEVSVGMEQASNIGITSCDSEFITIHDDDDTWHPKFLERAIETLQSHKFEGVTSHVNQIFEEIINNRIIIKRKRYFDPLLNNRLSYIHLQNKNYFLPISFVFSRKAYNQLCGFDEVFEVCGDWDFHYRFLQRYRLAVIKERLANYHVRSSVANTQPDSINSVKNKLLHKKYSNLFYTKHNINPNSNRFIV
ncbi:glycosyltransferase family 2 protein, partial [Rosenbergiella nectarea]